MSSSIGIEANIDILLGATKPAIFNNEGQEGCALMQILKLEMLQTLQTLWMQETWEFLSLMQIEVVAPT